MVIPLFRKIMFFGHDDLRYFDSNILSKLLLMSIIRICLFTMLAVKTFVGNTKINSTKKLHSVGVVLGIPVFYSYAFLTELTCQVVIENIKLHFCLCTNTAKLPESERPSTEYCEDIVILITNNITR